MSAPAKLSVTSPPLLTAAPGGAWNDSSGGAVPRTTIGLAASLLAAFGVGTVASARLIAGGGARSVGVCAATGCGMRGGSVSRVVPHAARTNAKSTEDTRRGPRIPGRDGPASGKMRVIVKSPALAGHKQV